MRGILTESPFCWQAYWWESVAVRREIYEICFGCKKKDGTKPPGIVWFRYNASARRYEGKKLKF